VAAAPARFGLGTVSADAGFKARPSAQHTVCARYENLSRCSAVIMYRVAHNKIPHQTICNISTTGGPILKILEAA